MLGFGNCHLDLVSEKEDIIETYNRIRIRAISLDSKSTELLILQLTPKSYFQGFLERLMESIIQTHY